jgi:hypothetical protein
VKKSSSRSAPTHGAAADPAAKNRAMGWKNLACTGSTPHFSPRLGGPLNTQAVAV